MRDRLIVALDVPSSEEAEHLIKHLGERLRIVKIGLELFLAAGPQIVHRAVSILISDLRNDGGS